MVELKVACVLTIIFCCCSFKISQCIVLFEQSISKLKGKQTYFFLWLPAPYKFHLVPPEAGAPPIRGCHWYFQGPGAEHYWDGGGGLSIRATILTDWSWSREGSWAPCQPACEDVLCLVVCAGSQILCLDSQVRPVLKTSASSSVCLCAPSMFSTRLYLQADVCPSSLAFWISYSFWT